MFTPRQVHYCSCQTDTLNVPEAGVGELNARKEELTWIEHSMHLLLKRSLEKDYISWAAFHASLQLILLQLLLFYHCSIKRLQPWAWNGYTEEDY